jgi:hypothetical protein
MPRFFDAAPIVPWSTWLRRQVLSSANDVSKVLPSSYTEIPMSPTGVPYESILSAHIPEYCAFLNSYFYPKEANMVLQIPEDHIRNEMQAEVLLGVEVRTDTYELVGIVFCRRMGKLNTEQAGLITWFCVHPDWRKRGLADYLLFAIVNKCLPMRVLIFRNDGLPRSIAPPIWTEGRITRTLPGTRSLHISRVSHEELAPKCIEYWKKKNPTGLILDSSEILSTLEWYSHKTKVMGTEYRYAVLVANLYEFRGTETSCEILSWFPVGPEAPDTIERFILDQIVTLLPYNRIEAPASMPRLEHLWSPCSQASWYIYGYDVGTPVTRPILSLAVA